MHACLSSCVNANRPRSIYERVRPVVLRHDIALRHPGQRPQVGGRSGELPDAVQRARLAGGPRSIIRIRVQARRQPLCPSPRSAGTAACLGVALELVNDGLDGPAQRGQVGRAGGEEAQQPPAAQNRGFDPLVVARHVRLGGFVAGDRLAEDAPLRWRERGPGLAVGEQDERPRPQADIRGQVPPDLVVLVAP